MLLIIPAIISSYLLGSIPPGYILVRLLRGIDIRQHGSGNIGATNVARILGKPAGMTVLLLDILKGFLATTLIANIFGVEEIIGRLALAVAVVCGHNWTIFLKFRGGKGVATTIGAIAGLALVIPGLRPVFLLSLLVWLVVFLLSKIVGLASIASSVSLTLFMVLFKQPAELVVLGLVFCVFIIVRHKSNIISMLDKNIPSKK